MNRGGEGEGTAAVQSLMEKLRDGRCWQECHRKNTKHANTL